MPMRKASRQIISINTSPPEDRVELLKTMDDTKEMEGNCEEICPSILLKEIVKVHQTGNFYTYGLGFIVLLKWKTI